MAGWFDSHCHVQEEYLPGDGAEATDLEPVLAPSGRGRHRPAGLHRDRGGHVAAGGGAWPGPRPARGRPRGHGPPSGCTRTRRVRVSTRWPPCWRASSRRTTASWWRSGSAGSTTTTSTRHATRNARPSPRRSRWRTRTTSRWSSTPATRGPICSTCCRRKACPNAPCCTASRAGPDEVEQCLRAGMYVSFSGIVTFKNAADVREAAARCPLDRLLVETDSPFLAPVPHRGRTNEPSYLPFVGDADRRGEGLPGRRSEGAQRGRGRHGVFHRELNHALLCVIREPCDLGV